MFFLIGITLVSGIGDSQGFIHAAKMWRSGALILSEFGIAWLLFRAG